MPFPGATERYRSWVLAKLPGNPEGLAQDQAGQIYASIYKTGEIVRVTPKGGYEHVAYVPSEQVGSEGITTGLEFDRNGNLYVAYMWHYSEHEEADPTHPACRDSRDRYTGIYKVDKGSHHAEPVLTKADGWPGCFPDDIAIDDVGNLYVTDLTLSGIWKIKSGGSYSLWCSDPLLQWPPPPYYSYPEGANDLVMDRKRQSLVVVTDGSPAIVRIPILADGTAGKPAIVARDLTALDGVELDEFGNIYVSEVTRNEISVFSPDGKNRVVIATAQTAPIINPTSLVYRSGTLCTANMAFAAKIEPRSIVCISGFRRPAK